MTRQLCSRCGNPHIYGDPGMVSVANGKCLCAARESERPNRSAARHGPWSSECATPGGISLFRAILAEPLGDSVGPSVPATDQCPVVTTASLPGVGAATRVGCPCDLVRSLCAGDHPVHCHDAQIAGSGEGRRVAMRHRAVQRRPMRGVRGERPYRGRRARDYRAALVPVDAGDPERSSPDVPRTTLTRRRRVRSGRSCVPPTRRRKRCRAPETLGRARLRSGRTRRRRPAPATAQPAASCTR